MSKHLGNIGDPKYVGPGVWYIGHLKAKLATDDKSIDEFINFMELLAAKFSCTNYRKHIRQYIDTHPFEDLRYLENDFGDKIGMFKWMWMFHNAVNARIGKEYVDWDTAWSMYDDSNVICPKGCQDAADNHNDSHDDNKKDNETITPIPVTRNRRTKINNGNFHPIHSHNNITPDDNYEFNPHRVTFAN